MREFIFQLLKKQVYKELKLIRAQNNAAIELDKIEKKLAELLTHAKYNCAYYKKRLLSYPSTSILSELPILTKHELAKYKNEILSTSLNDKFYAIKSSTSGSTGQATYFYSDLRDGRTARAYRGDEFVPGYNFLDKQLVFWGAERDIVASFSFKKLIHKLLYQTKIISTYHLKESDIKSHVDCINSYRPKTIVGYPSTLFFIAKVIKQYSLNITCKPNGIITSGEMLYPHQRELIESVFGVRIFNRYGCREFGHIANECVAHNGYHFNADDLIVEVVDENGFPCKKGEEGQILITDLNNYAFPMIRYAIGDRGVLPQIDSPCSCGSMLPKLQDISGRTFDVIHGVNGNRVSGTFWTLSFRNIVKGVDAFQVRQKTDFSITFYLKVSREYSKVHEKTLRNLVKDKLGDNKVVVKIVDDFDCSPTGKFKWIHSEFNK
jgi:phenylacetate-CoA ligase